jgi:hypothetical protein
VRLLKILDRLLLVWLEEVAASRDMSIDALLKFYIGHGLRKDKAKLFSDRQKHIN